MKNTLITMDHVMRLSRGKRSGAQIGSRAMGHHLKLFERNIFNRALLRGYLVVDKRDRNNLWHIWEKACLAKGVSFLVLMKDTHCNTGMVYQDNELVFSGPLKLSKQFIRNK